MKRPTIKGKGREIFFPESQLHNSKTPQQQASPTPNQQTRIPAEQRTSATPKRHYVKVTFWLPVELIRKLDSYWLKCRTEDRKATKSGIVSEALERFLK